MAKGLSYSPNEALIKGAAAIGMSKMPADQTALSKITELGTNILKEEGERRQKAEDAIDNTIAQVLADDGTLSDQHFDLATKQSQEYKEAYMQGVRMNNDEGNILKTKALNDLRKLSNSSNEETVLRKNLAKQKEDGLLSDNLDITTFNAYLEHDYTLKYKDDKKIYEINGTDYTYDDIKLFQNDLKNLDIKNINDTQINSLEDYVTYNRQTNTKTFKDERFNRIALDSVANTKRGFANQMKDNTIGGQQMSDLIMNSPTIVEEFEQEFPGFKFVDADGSGEIERSEKLDMIADAVLNTTNSAFDLQNSRQVIADLLTADARNKAQKDGLFYVEPEKSSGSGKEKTSIFMSAVGGYVDKAGVDNDVALLNSDAQDMPLTNSYNNLSWGRQKGQYYYLDPKTSEPVKTNYNSLLAMLKFDKKHGIERSAVIDLGNLNDGLKNVDLDKANQNIKDVDRTSDKTKKDVGALGNLLKP